MEKFSDLKISSSEKPKNLCDLPIEIVEMIVEKLDFTRRSFVRQTCKTLREIVDGLKPCCCNEIKITIGLEECELKLEGHSIKYKRSEGEDPKEILEWMLKRMFDDLLTFVPNLQTNTYLVQFYDEQLTWPIFRSVYKKCVPQPIKARLIEHRTMEKYEEGIIKVKILRIEWTDLLDNKGNRRLIIWPSYFKYFRERQEDIFVHESELVPAKNTKVMLRPLKYREKPAE
uniref:F-box domain-containing protein n=1 Tax=Caenorhabditis tropicalis TaxID=1561998 RepID=A0A1I7UEU9_9PELO